MLARAVVFLFLTACVAAVGLTGMLAGQTPITPPPLFLVGRTYAVVVDCLPVAVIPEQVDPCFTELLTVTSVRPDGWVVVTPVQGGPEWLINPVRVYSVRMQPNATQARQ